MPSVYKIRNVVNGKFYVGSSVNTRVRFQTHRRNLRKGTHHCPPLQNAWNKYGEDCFKFEIVEKVEDRSQLLPAENRWLDEHHGRGHCYNISRCAVAPMRGMKFSDEHRARISAALAARMTDEERAKLSAINSGNQHRLGHTNSPEHRQRISSAMKGKKKSPGHAEKIRLRMMGNSCAKGRVVAEEDRAARGHAVVEITEGLEFISTAAAAAHFGLERANVIRALRGDAPLKRGPRKGLHFRYVETATAPA